MRIFSSLVIDAPGLCSPSRIVVSNMIKCSLAMLPSMYKFAARYARAGQYLRPERLNRAGVNY
jgi:hypothetical protein